MFEGKSSHTFSYSSLQIYATFLGELVSVPVPFGSASFMPRFGRGMKRSARNFSSDQMRVTVPVNTREFEWSGAVEKTIISQLALKEI